MVIFRNFVYVSSYLQPKIFARKQDYAISLKLQIPERLSRSFKKALRCFYKLDEKRLPLSFQQLPQRNLESRNLEEVKKW